jgi:cytochrome P450
MISLSLFIAIIFSIALYFIFRVRYDSSGRTLILKFMCSLQGIPAIILKSNPKLCKAVLDACNTKGHGIEMHFAFPGWQPIYNSESVDGEKWKKLLSIFRKIVHKVNYSERLPEIIKKHCQKLAEDNPNIDSVVIQKLTARVFFELLFNKELSLSDEKNFIDATNEWRRHVAQKGDSDIKMKEKMIERIMECIRESQGVYDIEAYKAEFKADNYEVVSSFIQPFLISPMINFSDIFCELALLLEKNPGYKQTLSDSALGLGDSKEPLSIYLSVVYEAIRLKHPFPLLERELSQDVSDGKTVIPKGTHVFIELDSFIQSPKFQPENWMNQEYNKENSWILFATGPRMCAGRLIAIQAIEIMLSELIKNKKGDFKDLRFWENHKISGRKNDTTVSLKEITFQIKILFRVFKNLILKKK